MDEATAAPPVTGILVLDYHQPEATARCVASLLAREPATSRIVWLENDAARTREALMACLAAAAFPWVEVRPDLDPVPPPGTVAVILIPENLGYAGGNNVGLRFLQRHGIPYGWVLNNDTLLAAGSSRDLVAASLARPRVGAWGTVILPDRGPHYFGGIVDTRDFSIRLAPTPESLDDPLAFVSGCSLFTPVAIAAEAGFLPEDFFLYREDCSFSFLLRRAGHQLGGVWPVAVRHLESLSTGRRSPLMDYYNLRNRWFFIERFFPDRLAQQKRRIWYTVQKYLLRGKFSALRTEWAAYRDYRRGLLGRSGRVF